MVITIQNRVSHAWQARIKYTWSVFRHLAYVPWQRLFAFTEPEPVEQSKRTEYKQDTYLFVIVCLTDVFVYD